MRKLKLRLLGVSIRIDESTASTIQLTRDSSPSELQRTSTYCGLQWWLPVLQCDLSKGAKRAHLISRALPPSRMSMRSALHLIPRCDVTCDRTEQNSAQSRLECCTSGVAKEIGPTGLHLHASHNTRAHDVAFKGTSATGLSDFEIVYDCSTAVRSDSQNTMNVL